MSVNHKQNNQTETLQSYTFDGVEVTLTQSDLKFAQKMITQAFPVYSGIFQDANPKGAESFVAYQTLGYLRQKFGADFKMFHGADIEEVQAFVLEAAKDPSIIVYPSEDQFILMTHIKNRQGYEMEVNLQIFLSGPIITSSAIVNILSHAGFRDIEKDLDATIAYYSDLDAKNSSGGSTKAKMVKPNFIADQKLAYGANVVRRKSSVQLSTDYAQAAYGLLKSTGRTFKPTMNILNEMIAVKNKLGMTDEECDFFSAKADGLRSKAQFELDQINEYRKAIEFRAKELLGSRSFKNTRQGARLLAAGVPEHIYEGEMKKYGRQLWAQSLSEGDRKSLMKEAMTDREAEEIAVMNEEYSAKRAIALQQQCEGLGENALVKMAVAEYIRKYSDAKPDESGFSIFWDIFEDGIVQALHIYENLDKDVFVYEAPAAEFSAFFGNPELETRLKAVEEIKAFKAGDVVVVKPFNGVMALELKAGLFVPQNKKTLMAFPLAPEGHYFEATVVSVNKGQKGTEGISIRLSNVKHHGGEQAVEVPQPKQELQKHAFTLTQQAQAFVKQVVAEHGDEMPFLLQEFYVLGGALQMVVGGKLMPVSEVNPSLVSETAQPMAIKAVKVEADVIYCA